MIGVIGCGNMASAIVKGIHAIYKDEKFLTYTPSKTRALELAESVNGKQVDELKGMMEADTLMIGCKPQQFDELAGQLTKSMDLKDKHIVSIMAAMPVETIKKKLGTTKVTRVMPNTPMLYNEGISLVLNSGTTEREETNVLKWFSACGKVHMLDNEQSFDQVTTVSGSGPAYVFQFAKSMVDKLETWGVEQKQAREIVTQLFKGSTKLMELNNDITLDELINQVTSKGGVTIEAVKVYRAEGIDKMTSKALDAAYSRSEVMTKELGSL
ncbi:MAG: pyrroline-5-carboxylate reductase [Halobacteriovoraceae bacterium]|nr:pyrroline-5-carboxylate reductase [Halobacteriovoraceae bacterium]|tara:strand:- start:12982 stop:13788 length:807 start_codon:yes stop_codon:yes gene_type:complete